MGGKNVSGMNLLKDGEDKMFKLGNLGGINKDDGYDDDDDKDEDEKMFMLNLGGINFLGGASNETRPPPSPQCINTISAFDLISCNKNYFTKLRNAPQQKLTCKA